MKIHTSPHKLNERIHISKTAIKLSPHRHGKCSCMRMLLHCSPIELRNKDLCEIWSGYGKWSECSKSCGSGTQVRSRRVITVERTKSETCRPVRGRRQQTRICSGRLCGGTGRLALAPLSFISGITLYAIMHYSLHAKS